MAFAFGFGGDDIDDDENDVAMADDSIEAATDARALLPPKLHDLDAMLAALPASLRYTQPANLPPRRALYDIRAQLMTEADPQDLTTHDIGLSTDDIVAGLYEGGFKTWECAADLAAFAPKFCAAALGASSRALTVVELGAGTAAPACALLTGFLATRGKTTSGTAGASFNGSATFATPTTSVTPPASLRLVVADYNAPVLRLASGPNVFLAGAAAMGLLAPAAAPAAALQEGEAAAAEHDIDVSASLRAAVRAGLRARGASVSFVEGAWGSEFVELFGRIEAAAENPPAAEASAETAPGTAAHASPLTLILASETIYAPGSLSAFTATLLGLLRAARQAGGEARALVAAKRVYFGVGGGVAEFEAELGRRGGSLEEVWASDGAGVGRCIVEVRANG